MRRRVVAIAVPLGIVSATAVALWADRRGGLDAGARDPSQAEAVSPVRGGGFAPSPKRRYALVWAVGDGADGSEAAKTLARRIAASKPDRFLYLGDVYTSGTAEEFRRNYHTVYGPLVSVTAPTLGDNEWPNRREGYDAYWRRVTGEAARRYYAFKLRGWTILSLTSQRPADEAQLRWLRTRVRQSGTCRLAYWHHSPFSAGHYGDDPRLEPLWAALRGRAAVVVSAHDHNMQRFAPVGGITSFVSGAGGGTLYDVGDDPRLAFARATGGALRLELRRGSVRHAFVATDGRTLDAGTIRCTPTGDDEG